MSQPDTAHTAEEQNMERLLEEPAEPALTWVDPELTAQEKVLHGLHLVCLRDITEYDPKREDFVYTRFCSFNLAFFDLDEESTAMHGPPFEELLMSQMHLMPSSSVNIISLKIIESDVGYPVDVFGTLIARDEVDYKCIYLFRRERDDSQRIYSPEDMLTLTGPRRGFGVTDTMFFEINLKIRGDTSVDDKDFSKGVIEHCSVEHFKSMRPVAHLLTSWRSTVELLCSQVAWPVGATVKVNIMNGPRDVPFNGKISAWTVGNVHHHIILYKYNGKTGTCSPALIEDDGSIVLARSFVAVPVPLMDNMLHLREDDDEEEEDIVLYVCFISGSNEDERTIVTLRFPEEGTVCNHGYYELRVKVSWTTILDSLPRGGRSILERFNCLPNRPRGPMLPLYGFSNFKRV